MQAARSGALAVVTCIIAGCAKTSAPDTEPGGTTRAEQPSGSEPATASLYTMSQSIPSPRTPEQFIQYCGRRLPKGRGHTFDEALKTEASSRSQHGTCTDGKRWLSVWHGFGGTLAYYSADGRQMVGSVQTSDASDSICGGLSFASTATDFRTLLCEVNTWSGDQLIKPSLLLADGARLGLDPHALPPEAHEPKLARRDPTLCSGRFLRCNGSMLERCDEPRWVAIKDCTKPELCSMVGPTVGCKGSQ